MSFKTIGMFVGLFLLAGVFASSFVAAGNVVLKTVPAQSTWIANGVTEYRMDVYADNTHAAESTRSITLQLVAPEGMSQYMTMTRWQLPSTDDFFATALNCNYYGGWWGMFGRSCSLPGVSNSQGRVVSYWFTVSPGAPVGSKSFDLNGDNVQIYGPSGDQSYIVDNMPFNVVKAPRQIAVVSPNSLKVCPAGTNC